MIVYVWFESTKVHDEWNSETWLNLFCQFQGMRKCLISDWDAMARVNLLILNGESQRKQGESEKKKDRVDCIHLGQGSIIINMQHYLLYHYYCFLGYLSYECMTCVVSMKFCRLSPVVFFGFFQKGLLKDFLIKLE